MKISPNSSNSLQKNKDSLLRAIFLNILIIIFIVMCYVYSSEYYGSISTPYIQTIETPMLFGLAFFIFTFFSILAGPIQGFVAGFFGELIYQLAFYSNLNLAWCFIVAIIGFLFGMYKYKPLKYKGGKKIFRTIIVMIVTSLIAMAIVISFNYIFNFNQVGVAIIALNQGLKFFIQALVTIVFFIPLVLFLYDRVLAKKERFIYHEILTHHLASASDHTFNLKFGRTRIFFCSRCSGVIIGGLIAMFSTYLIERIYNTEISAEIAVLMCILFPIPGLVDWGTQRLLLRKSTTESRLFTGFVIGVALHLMSFTSKYALFMLFLLIIDFSILGVLMFLGSKKEKKRLIKQMDPLNSEENDE